MTTTLVLLLLGGGVGGWVWWSSPKAYTAVAVIPVASDTLAPTERGVLVVEGNAFVMRGWVDGSEIWRVTPPANAGISPMLSSVAGSHPWSISPSGRYLAVMARTGDGGGQRYITWKDGVQVGAYDGLLVPGTASTDDIRLQVLDAGRLLVVADGAHHEIYSFRRKQTKQLFVPIPPPVGYVLQGTRLLAKGPLLNGDNLTIALDSTAVATSGGGVFTYANLATKNGRIVLSGKYSGSESLEQSFYKLGHLPGLQIATDGLLYAGNGRVFGPKGLVTPAPGKGWEPEMGNAVSPNGQYCIFLNGRRDSFAESKETPTPKACRIRVISPVSGETREWVKSGSAYFGMVCNNGFPLLIIENQVLVSLRWATGWIPAVKQRLEQRTWVMALYTPSGRMLAGFPVREDERSIYITARGQRYDMGTFAPSPDGRTLAFIGETSTGDEAKQSLILYRY